VDVGNHAYSLGRYLESAGQPVLMSGYLGSIGFGYPAAPGAWAAAPARPILAVTGDGGFGQYSAELLTPVKYGIPIKHLLLDNRSLGKISKEQLAAGVPVWHTNEDGIKHCAQNVLCTLQHIGYTIPPQADAGWIGEAGPGQSYLDPGSGGPENDFTNRNTTFMTWNLMHLARILKDAGGIPAYGNQRSEWDAGCRFDYENPEYR